LSFCACTEKSTPTAGNKFKVEGTVSNAATGKPIRGIRLTYKEFAASITDSSGKFTINIPGDKGLLLLEGDGYQSKEVPVQDYIH